MTDELEPTIKATPTWQTKVGIGLTVFWLIVVAIYVFKMWSIVFAMKPDAFATFLGGIFAPLGFFWLVIGYFQQGAELRHNVEALRLQSVELRNSVEQQRELVTATRDQIDFEKSALVAKEEADARAFAPVFRLVITGHEVGFERVSAALVITNSGQKVWDAEVAIRTLGKNAHRPVFDHTENIVFALNHELIKNDDLPNLDVEISFRDGRGQQGLHFFTIIPEYDEKAGLTWGNTIIPQGKLGAG